MNIHEHNSHKTKGIECNKCDFTAKNEAILQKHHKVAMGHKKSGQCRYFANGNCRRGKFCLYEHNTNMTNRQHSQPNIPNPKMHKSNFYSGPPKSFGSGTKVKRECRYKENCYTFPNCGFLHPEICKYQERCFKGYSCPYVHLQADLLGRRHQSASWRI